MSPPAPAARPGRWITLLLAAACAVLLALPAIAGAAAVPSIAAKPGLNPRFSPTASDYASRCRLGHPLRLTIRAPGKGRVRIGRRKPMASPAKVSLRVRVGQRVTVRMRWRGRTVAYNVRCIPVHFPKWTAERHGTPQAMGYLVTPTLGGSGSHVVALFDRNGAPVWWMERRDKPHDAKLLPNGHFAWTRFTNIAIASHAVPYEEHRLDGRLVRRIKTIGVPTDGHDLQMLPNGNYLVMSYALRDGVDLSAYGGPAGATVIDAEVQEVTPGGRLVWRWNSKDHIDLSEAAPFMNIIIRQPGPLSTGDGRKAYDIMHINSAEDAGDSIIVSLRHTSAVYKISKATGAIEWKLGGTSTPESLSIDGGSENPLASTGQHDARVLPDGTLTMHDNRTLTPFGPRAVRFRIDPAARTATTVEEVGDPAALHSLCCGGARKLPRGNWVMSWGFSPLVTELTPSGKRVFALRFRRKPKAFSYRAFPVLPGQLSIRALRAGMDAMAR
jgi:hypothetical protein